MPVFVAFTTNSSIQKKGRTNPERFNYSENDFTANDNAKPTPKPPWLPSGCFNHFEHKGSGCRTASVPAVP